MVLATNRLEQTLESSWRVPAETSGSENGLQVKEAQGITIYPAAQKLFKILPIVANPCWNPFNGPFSLRVKSKTLPWSPRRRPCMPPASSQLQALILSPLVHSLKFQDLKCSLPSASRPSQMLLFQPRTPVCPTSSTLPVNLLAHLECCISEQFLLTFYIKTGLLFTFHHSTLYFSFTAFNTIGIKLFVE